MRALAMVICLALTMQFASGCGTTESAQSTQENVTTIVETFDFAAVPAYDGTAYVAVNDNVPFFTEEELSSASYETYGELDPLGRCTVCVASVGQDLMPAEEYQDRELFIGENLLAERLFTGKGVSRGSSVRAAARCTLRALKL